MVDHSNMKLGRRHAKTDSRTLRLAKYFKDGLPAAPPAKDWTKKVKNWGMMLNDVHACCTIAAAAHAVQVWSAHTQGEITIRDSMVMHYFEKWDGYDPSNPKTDAGGVELDVLKAWRKSVFDTHKLFAFASVSCTNLEEIRQAIHLFGGVYIGINLPITAKKQAIWDVVPHGGADARPGSWGGHAVFVPKYEGHGFTCVTWGELKPMTSIFWNKYVDEAHVLLGHDWIEQMGSPAGFDLQELKADVAKIT